MARPRAKTPARRYHVSGQSVVTIDGRDFYLGRHDSPEALARYAVVIAQYQRNGCRLPDDFDPQSIRDQAAIILGEPAQHQADQPILVEHVTASFREWAQSRYQKGAELNRITRLLNEVETHNGKDLAEKFGPLALQRQRQRWVDSGVSRRYANRQTNLLVRVFKHAVGQELVSPEVWQRLKAVEPLRLGATAAPETDPRKPVSLETVRATVKFLSPTIRDMVRIQVATGLRPCEVCGLRPIDVDRSGPVWMYRPVKHKTSHHNKRKATPLLGDAREALEDYLNRHPEAFCFSPQEAIALQNAQRRSARKTPVQPSQMNRQKTSPKMVIRDRYDTASLAQAIRRACKRAGVVHWSPYRLRHLVGTTVRDSLGVEAAGALLGHSQLSMTEVYTATAEKLAIEAAKVAPKL